MSNDSELKPGIPIYPQEDSAFCFIERIDLNYATRRIMNGILDIGGSACNETRAKELLALATNKINTLSIRHSKILKFNTKLITTSNRKRRAKTARYLSFLHVALATIAQEKNSEIMAWRAISRAEYYLGLAEALLDPHIAESKSKGKKGGDKKALNAKTLNERINTLLSERSALTRGSETPSATANAIAAALMKEKEEGKISFPLTEDDLRSKILNLIVETTLKK